VIHLTLLPTLSDEFTRSERLRIARERAGYSVSEFALKARLPRAAILAWENPGSEPNLAAVLPYLAICHNTSAEWILYEAGEKPSLPDVSCDPSRPCLARGARR
jgi:transcriptional regulator with XRE-family HTH domain